MLSCVRLFATPWTAALQASLSFTISRSLHKLMFVESVIPSNHLFLCHALLLPSIFPSIRERTKQISYQTRPQLLNGWPGAGAALDSGTLCPLGPTSRSDAWVWPFSSCYPAIFSVPAMLVLPSWASRKPTPPSRSSSDVTFSGKPSWISSRHHSQPLSGFSRQTELAASKML